MRTGVGGAHWSRWRSAWVRVALQSSCGTPWPRVLGVPGVRWSGWRAPSRIRHSIGPVALQARVWPDPVTAGTCPTASGGDQKRVSRSPGRGRREIWSRPEPNSRPLAGLPAVVIVDGLSFLVVAIATAGVRSNAAPLRGRSDHPGPSPGPRPGPSPTTEARTVAGLRVLRRTRPLSALLVTTTTAQVEHGMFLVLFIAFVVRSLGGNEADVGLIRGMQAVGGVIGGVLLATSRRRRLPATLIGAGFLGMAICGAVFWNLPAVTTSIAVHAVLMAAAGPAATACGVGITTAVQQYTRPSTSVCTSAPPMPRPPSVRASARSSTARCSTGWRSLRSSTSRSRCTSSPRSSASAPCIRRRREANPTAPLARVLSDQGPTVGLGRFELPTPCPPDKCANQAALQPV